LSKVSVKSSSAAREAGRKREAQAERVGLRKNCRHSRRKDDHFFFALA
jgi:hypothetical protein